MKNNRFTEIRNRTEHIQDLLNELDDVIKEAELDCDINRKAELNKSVDLAASAVSNIEEDEEYIKQEEINMERRCLTPHIFVTGIAILLIVLVMNNI